MAMKDAMDALGRGKSHAPRGKGKKGKVKHVKLHKAASGHVIATHEMEPENGEMPEGNGDEHVLENSPEAIGAHVHAAMNGGEPEAEPQAE